MMHQSQLLPSENLTELKLLAMRYNLAVKWHLDRQRKEHRFVDSQSYNQLLRCMSDLENWIAKYESLYEVWATSYPLCTKRGLGQKPIADLASATQLQNVFSAKEWGAWKRSEYFTKIASGGWYLGDVEKFLKTQDAIMAVGMEPAR